MLLKVVKILPLVLVTALSAISEAQTSSPTLRSRVKIKPTPPKSIFSQFSGGFGSTYIDRNNRTGSSLLHRANLSFKFTDVISVEAAALYDQYLDPKSPLQNDIQDVEAGVSVTGQMGPTKIYGGLGGSFPTSQFSQKATMYWAPYGSLGGDLTLGTFTAKLTNHIYFPQYAEQIIYVADKPVQNTAIYHINGLALTYKWSDPLSSTLSARIVSGYNYEEQRRSVIEYRARLVYKFATMFSASAGFGYNKDLAIAESAFLEKNRVYLAGLSFAF